jgi:hypothetical protein
MQPPEVACEHPGGYFQVGVLKFTSMNEMMCFTEDAAAVTLRM